MTASKQSGPTGAPEPPEEPDGITQEEIDRLLQEEQLEDEDFSLDDAFDVLRNRRRRDILKHLAAADDNTATLSDLAEQVAAKENGIDRSELTSTQRKRVYIGLYQCHLPKMDDLGVIDYDQDRGTVVLENGSKLLSYLPDTAEDDDQSPIPLYAALAVSGVLTVGLLGPGPVAAVPTPVWAVLSTGVLIAVGLFLAELRGVPR
jgi:hypothetical protein